MSNVPLTSEEVEIWRTQHVDGEYVLPLSPRDLPRLFATIDLLTARCERLTGNLSIAQQQAAGLAIEVSVARKVMNAGRDMLADYEQTARNSYTGGPTFEEAYQAEDPASFAIWRDMRDRLANYDRLKPVDQWDLPRRVSPANG